MLAPNKTLFALLWIYFSASVFNIIFETINVIFIWVNNELIKNKPLSFRFGSEFCNGIDLVYKIPWRWKRIFDKNINQSKNHEINQKIFIRNISRIQPRSTIAINLFIHDWNHGFIILLLHYKFYFPKPISLIFIVACHFHIDDLLDRFYPFLWWTHKLCLHWRNHLHLCHYFQPLNLSKSTLVEILNLWWKKYWYKKNQRIIGCFSCNERDCIEWASKSKVYKRFWEQNVYNFTENGR